MMASHNVSDGGRHWVWEVAVTTDIWQFEKLMVYV